MLKALHSTRGMVTAPHHLAAQAGLDILKEGGNAVEAMVAAAATIAVVYPHMNSIGGDGFWLIAEPGKPPIGVDACGPAVRQANRAFYEGLDAIPARGPKAALTVPGSVAGWQVALKTLPTTKPLPLSRLLEAATHYARHGSAVSRSQATLTRQKLAELQGVPGFSDTFLVAGQPPSEGDILTNPALAATLERLATAGLRDLYDGELAATLSADLAKVGSPIALGDLTGYAPLTVAPLTLPLRCGQLYNMPPPTQGLASLLILGLFERLGVQEADGFAHLHGLVEATKAAFKVRDQYLTDPTAMAVAPGQFLSGEWLDQSAASLSMTQAAPWPAPAAAGDTVWLGAIDGEGRAVSFIQSIYWEFGSGVVSPSTGILLQNRGMTFSLAENALRSLAPGRRPFHTLNPAMAQFNDGRTLVYGTMGGEGQPQTQAALFSRYGLFGADLQAAITAPRWLLGRTWAETSTTLKLESRFDLELIAALRQAGHDVEVVAPFSDQMGHAGAIVRHPSGLLAGATDPRADGIVAGF